MKLNARLTAYWITAGLTAFVFLAGGAADLYSPPAVVELLTQLGYPAYVARILGFWKVLGAIAILAPGWPLLKEWAYAGIVFDLTGAAALHAAVGEPVGKIAPAIVILAIAMASWALRPGSRKLRGVLGGCGEPIASIPLS